MPGVGGTVGGWRIGGSEATPGLHFERLRERGANVFQAVALDAVHEALHQNVVVRQHAARRAEHRRVDPARRLKCQARDKKTSEES